MSFFRNLSNVALLSLAMTCSMTSCEYLDIVPPEQPDLQDANKDRAGTLGFLYSCYAGVINPRTMKDWKWVRTNTFYPACGKPEDKKFNGI